jgi:hypothetical protein
MRHHEAASDQEDESCSVRLPFIGHKKIVVDPFEKRYAAIWSAGAESVGRGGIWMQPLKKDSDMVIASETKRNNE